MQQAAGEAQQHSRFHPAQADLEQVQCPKAQCSAVPSQHVAKQHSYSVECEIVPNLLLFRLLFSITRTA
jgi:hypothetical protein